MIGSLEKSIFVFLFILLPQCSEVIKYRSAYTPRAYHALRRVITCPVKTWTWNMITQCTVNNAEYKHTFTQCSQLKNCATWVWPFCVGVFIHATLSKSNLYCAAPILRMRHITDLRVYVTAQSLMNRIYRDGYDQQHCPT